MSNLPMALIFSCFPLLIIFCGVYEYTASKERIALYESCNVVAEVIRSCGCFTVPKHRSNLDGVFVEEGEANE